MNLEKLAQLAGVSLGTVSKAFSGSHEIGEQTRNRIFELAKEHNCFEKYYKAKREKKVIAVICPELESSYYCSIVSRIESELNRQGAMMFLALSGFNAKKEAEIVSYLISSKSADGILIVAASSRVRFNKDVPIVAVNTKRDLSEVDCINVAFKDTIIEAIKYLKDCGHKKIAYIGEMHTKAKLNMFLNAMQHNDLDVNPKWLFTEKARFEEAGKAATEKIFAMENQPTAIFCAYDNVALGAIEAIKKHGKSVPDDFSIIGIDDIPIASHVNVSLTTIKSNNNTICDMAVELLLKKIESKFFSLRQKISLRTELVKRNSVKKIN
ncbi:MAG: LacI family DNA-binding transcriptional regulator [Clostridia bacterium]|nr:LacI family DNA-binding transcriptional regulator [Clostridia bacterium]MBR2448895.1 LacI family DNA-binding transcriptional regulator [Clostridia bacterium]